MLLGGLSGRVRICGFWDGVLSVLGFIGLGFKFGGLVFKVLGFRVGGSGVKASPYVIYCP